MSNLRILELEAFIKRKFSKHFECDDTFYSCPRTEDYIGFLESLPIDERPCLCGYEDACHILRLPEWKDPQLQFEAEEPEMPKGDW